MHNKLMAVGVLLCLAARTDDAGGAPTTAAEPTEKLTPEQKRAKSLADFQAKLSTNSLTLVDKTFSSLGLDVKVGVPSSVADFDVLAGKEGACLDAAISNVIYRGVLAEFRDLFCDKLAEKLNVEREVVYAKNADGTDKLVNGEKVFVKYVLSEAKFVKTHCGDNVEQFQALANEVAAELFFDPSSTERTPGGPKKLAKMYTEAAQQLITKGSGDKVAAALTKKLGYEVQATVESLGAAIKDDQSRKPLAAEYEDASA